jgi:hypothetical protein
MSALVVTSSFYEHEEEIFQVKDKPILLDLESSNGEDDKDDEETRNIAIKKKVKELCETQAALDSEENDNDNRNYSSLSSSSSSSNFKFEG